MTKPQGTSTWECMNHGMRKVHRQAPKHGAGLRIENDRQVKRYRSIEIPDGIKCLPFSDFKFDVPANGAISFKIMFEASILPTEWPELR